MKLFSLFIMTAVTALTCSMANPIKVQAAEAAPTEAVLEVADPTIAYEDTLFSLVNEERTKHGLHTFAFDEMVDIASKTRIGELKTVFSHKRENGAHFSTALDDHGISYTVAAEIIAAGQNTPESALHAWLNSPGHYNRLIDPKYTKIGVSHHRAEDGIDYWEIIFTN